VEESRERMSEKKITKKAKESKPKVQNELDETLLAEAVRGLLSFEAKKSVSDNKLLDNYAKPILLQVLDLPLSSSPSVLLILPSLSLFLDSIKATCSFFSYASYSYKNPSHSL
jgi:hypothetical protein